jgi:integrase/recombinase XerD
MTRSAKTSRQSRQQAAHGTLTALMPVAEAADGRLIAQWLHGRPETTLRAYARDVRQFFEHIGTKPLREVSVDDLQSYAESLDRFAPRSQARAITAVRSLLRYAGRSDVADKARTPAVKHDLAERILPEEAVHAMIAAEPDDRNKTMLRLLYASGLRVAELVGLTWRDVVPRGDEGGQLTIWGKGRKTRWVRVYGGVWDALLQLRPEDAAPTDPVFASRKGGALHPSQVHRIVQAAARRVGIEGNVSPHWLRHAHASHSLDRGAPVSLVQQTLGHSSLTTTSRYLHARPGESSGRYLAV